MNTTKLIKNYSEYLSFRSFYTGFPVEKESVPVISNTDEAIALIKETLSNTVKPALLLSGGMDSAVLLPFMPKGTTAYTLYHERLESNEVEIAKHYCDKFSVNHVAILIEPEECFTVMDELMINKKMPLSPAEPLLYLAAKQANRDGYKEIVTGGGADARLGGFSRFRRPLFSAQYQKKIQKRYLRPKNILKYASSLDSLFDQYLIPIPENKPVQRIIRSLFPAKRNRNIIDSKRFLREVGVERFAFDNAISFAGCKHVAPYSQFIFDFDEELNAERPKYFIQDLYFKIYNQAPPKKLGLQKPTYMLKGYYPKNVELFKSNIDINSMKYAQVFLVYCLERFEALRQQGKV